MNISPVEPVKNESANSKTEPLSPFVCFMVADWEMERNRAVAVFTKNLGKGTLKGELCSDK